MLVSFFVASTLPCLAISRYCTQITKLAPVLFPAKRFSTQSMPAMHHHLNHLLLATTFYGDTDIVHRNLRQKMFHITSQWESITTPPNRLMDHAGGGKRMKRRKSGDAQRPLSNLYGRKRGKEREALRRPSPPDMTASPSSSTMIRSVDVGIVQWNRIS